MESSPARDLVRVQRATLTPSQREAVWSDEGALCVIAGAGAGKTRVLTLRVARRVHDGSASPDHTLVATFSRKAAEELESRLFALGVSEGIRAGTFHRIALLLLRQYAADHQRAAPELLTDRLSFVAKTLELAKRRRATVDRRDRAVLNASQVEGEIGWAKARMIGPEDYESEVERQHRRPPAPPDKIAELYARYEEARRAQRLFDFDDLLLSTGDLLAKDQKFAEAVRWRFRHLFVDEMQDMNAAQFRLLTSLIGDEPDLFCVGDPNQSVYGWNGADPGLLMRLPSLLPGTRVLHLDANHRSSPQVVQVATAALGSATVGAPLSTRGDGAVPRVVNHESDQAEAEWIAREVWVAHRPGRRWRHVAVLARTNAQLVVIADALRRAKIPYSTPGREFGPASDLNDDSEEPEELDVEPGTTEAEAVTEVQRDLSPESADPWDTVVLSTFHRAKGLQWPAVFVVGLSDGLVPLAWARSEAARLEERRLLYVALTRAEDDLTCSWVRFAEDGRERRPSPWLHEIGETCTELAGPQGRPTAAAITAHLAEARARLRAKETDDQ